MAVNCTGTPKAVGTATAGMVASQPDMADRDRDRDKGEGIPQATNDIRGGIGVYGYSFFLPLPVFPIH